MPHFFNEIYNSLSQFQQSQYYTIDIYNAQYSDAHLSILSMNIRSFNANIEAFVFFYFTFPTNAT